ncbi:MULTISPECIES: VgrG-related protein [unclassified Nostoc]|uniref:VgrG-related protein n=1 Tax=unclassified Nostoc TaxID=2593658 RepID=UPI002AD5805B|nr:VgrG-related protein [Nostoc sp. DedQUE03]MDZ7973103.1 VgrG-related protein [Nostoc sp. DedQUE03]MDZ8046928.1 VgrG-related protein [Nostoc sp. DedQUE02]
MPASYTAIPTLKIDGQPASDSLLEDILQITVEESLHVPGMFTLVIRNDYYSAREGENPWLYDNTFTIGKSIEIGFTSSNTEDADFNAANQSTLLKGEITAVEAQFNAESQAPIIIQGYDVSHRLHRGRYNRSFQNKKDSDIVSQIIGEAGITAGTIDETGGPYGFGDPVGYIFQENQTNMEFLRERAARNGFELFVQDGKLNFRKPSGGNSLNLKWLKDITNFHVRVSSTEQVSSVEVRGWDYKNKQAIVSTKSAQTAQVVTSIDQGKGTQTSTAFNSSPKMIVVDKPVFSSKESDAIAQALFNELSGEFVQADAQAVGNPDIRPGKVISLKDMGKYSGSYYVTETRHIFQSRVYNTEFSIRGLRGDDLFTAMTPQARLQPGQTLIVGIVTNNNDPKKWSRVRVKFPTLTEEHESDWARVVGIGAGSSRGFDCLPEVNDEVLIGFEHGDIHRPFVIGNVWNGKDAPPTSVQESVADGKVRLRTFKTRLGHTLQFVEEDKGSSKKGVYVNTVDGHKLNINDTDKKIEIKTKDGHQVLLDDQKKKIEIKTNGGNICNLDDQGRKITLTGTGEIELTAPQKITLKVGGSSIEVSMSNIKLRMGGNTIELGGAGIKIESAMTTTVKGLTTTIKGDTTVAVNAPVVNIS